MAFTVDALTISSNFDTNNFSFSHTTAGDQRLLVVSIHFHDNVNVTAVTYGGQSMTEIGDRAHSGGGRVFMWYLKDPPSGANTVQLTHATAEGRAVARSWNGAETGSDPLDSNNDDIGDSQAPSTSFTTVKSNCLLVGAAVWDDDGVAGTPGSGFTERYDAIAGSGIAQRGYLEENLDAGDPASETVNASFTGGALPWAIIGAAFMPVQGPDVNDAITVAEAVTVRAELNINPTNPGVKVYDP